MTDAETVEPRIDRGMLARRIERLNVSADVKALLSSMIDKTIEVGGKLVNIGARVMEFVFELAKAYPGVAFGIVAALVLSFLISSIPVVGPLLTPILTPLLLIVGVSLGALDDLTDGGMRDRLHGLQARLKASGVA